MRRQDHLNKTKSEQFSDQKTIPVFFTAGLILPAIALAQARDVRGVMAAVPGVAAEQIFQVELADFWMVQSAFEIGGMHGFEHHYPSLMKRVDQAKRWLDGPGTRVRYLRPEVLVIRLYGRFLLRQGEAEANVRIDVAVSQMMNHLPNCPTLRPVWSVEMFVGESPQSLAQIGGQRTDFIDQLLTALGSEIGLWGELSHRIPEVGHIVL